MGVVPGLRRVHSISQAGLSQITLEFNWGTAMDYAALDVREKIDLVRLPGDIIIERENFRFYLPITTMLIASVVISLIIWLFRQ